jgi:hypothetical protein
MGALCVMVAGCEIPDAIREQLVSIVQGAIDDLAVTITNTGP